MQSRSDLDSGATSPRRRHLLRLALAVLLASGTAYFLAAYKFVPSAWRFVERRHPALGSAATRASTAAGIPGDPFNLAIVATQETLLSTMLAAGWSPADPVTWRSSLRIAVDSVAHRPYADAPVSPLFLDGRQQDFAFEAAAARDPSQRHHVRFWRLAVQDALGRDLWMGAATFDRGVGVSHTTGQITHHIAADIDAERDKLLRDIERARSVEVSWVDGYQSQREGHNGGGDAYFTDGRLAVIETDPALAQSQAPHATPP